MKLTKAVSLRLSELLKKNNMTQYQLHIKSGVPESTVSAIVRCINNKITANIIFELAAGLNMTLQQFFDSPLFSPENITD